MYSKAKGNLTRFSEGIKKRGQPFRTRGYKTAVMYFLNYSYHINYTVMGHNNHCNV